MTYNSILLIKVPICPFPDPSAKILNTSEKFRPFPSLALAALCGFVDKYKTRDYQLQAVDLNIEGYTAPGVDIDTTKYPDLLDRCLKDRSYDVLGLSVAFIFNERWVELAVKLSKQYHPEAKIIIGGGYPTLFPERILNRLPVDDVVLGEGEATFLHLLNKYNDHHDETFANQFAFDGYATRHPTTGEIVVRQRQQRQNFLSGGTLPPPAWHYLGVEKYFRNSGSKLLPLEVSRGCPYKCTYCCTYLSWGRWMRYKPVEQAIAEIQELKTRYGNPELYFIDDNPTVSKKWMKPFLTRLIETGLAGNVTLQNVSVNHIDEEMLDLLIKAGSKNIGMAVESGSKEMQKRLDKNLDFDKVRKAAKMIKAKGLVLDIVWLVGIPGETLAQIQETFSLARELGAHSNLFSIVLPYPGTRLYEMAKREGLLIDSEYEADNFDRFNYHDCRLVKSDEWDSEMLQKMIFDARIEIDYLNSPYLDTPESMDKLLSRVDEVMDHLSDHVIAHVVIGYMYYYRNNLAQGDKYYDQAITLLQRKELHEMFHKYLSWQHPIIHHFNQYLGGKGITL